jgi:hypothetical protein
MSALHAIAAATAFCWLGMVIAISFIEAPLKFRASGVTLQIALSIGRLVFRALNCVEALLAAILLITLGIDPPSRVAGVATAVAAVTLGVQLVIVRPRLSRRSDAVLNADSTEDTSRRSRAHYGYVALELTKSVALIAAGSAILAA